MALNEQISGRVRSAKPKGTIYYAKLGALMEQPKYHSMGKQCMKICNFVANELKKMPRQEIRKILQTREEIKAKTFQH